MIELRGVSRAYGTGEQRVLALDNVSLRIDPHECVSITGPSGCGKSTLMHLIGGLDSPSAGEVFVDSIPLHSAGEEVLTDFRRRTLGIVFQFFNLLPTMTVLENVSMPLLLQGVPLVAARERAAEWVRTVGMENRSGHFPHQLSGGELQRTAIARALIHEPKVLLADEPTGNLDSANAAQVLELFGQIAARKITTLVIVTHSEEVARATARRIQMRDGKIERGKAEI